MNGPGWIGGLCRAVAAAAAALGLALLGAGAAGAADPVQLKSRMGNWCVDAPNGNNTATMINPCDGSASQRWILNPAGQIQSAAFAGNCLSISAAADRTPVTLSPCAANTNGERWNHEANGKMTSALGPCLNIFGGVAAPGTPLIAYQCIPNVADEEWDSVG